MEKPLQAGALPAMKGKGNSPKSLFWSFEPKEWVIMLKIINLAASCGLASFPWAGILHSSAIMNISSR